MRKIYFFFTILFCYFYMLAQSSYPDIENNRQTTLQISSDDENLVNLFNWATKSSKRYVGNDHDPVGPWYESALPEREAFCIRDISHQCIGEEINGHGKQNLNMFTKFVENISESKDWCTYWEINRYNLPAPADYVSDEDFWYNLNANFDIIDACYKLYLWTGNKTYIEDPVFDCFFRLSLNEYIERWQLQADKIMDRPALMNMPLPPPEDMQFKHARGLPSYDESMKGFNVNGDLIAMIYAGFMKYAEIQKIKGNTEQYQIFRKKADEYKELYNTVWWNDQTGKYYTFFIDGKLIKNEYINLFVPWYGIIDDPQRLSSVLEEVTQNKTIVECKSYFPLIYYKNSFPEVAYNYMNELYTDSRRNYPEVASSLIESVVCGLAGIDVNAAENRIGSCPRFTDKTHWISIENIPTFTGLISIMHTSEIKSSFMHKGKQDVTWRVMFEGEYPDILCNGKKIKALSYADIMGNVYSYVDISCPAGECITAEVSLN